MGENGEIFDRLRTVETELARMSERVVWMTRLIWLLFPSGGLFGWALAKVWGGG